MKGNQVEGEDTLVSKKEVDVVSARAVYEAEAVNPNLSSPSHTIFLCSNYVRSCTNFMKFFMHLSR